MADLASHQAIGVLFLQKHKGFVKNEEEFLKGNLAPDLKPDKIASHFGKVSTKTDYLSNLKDKVNIFEFLKQNKLKTDFDKGYFLHLITDIVFYKYVYCPKLKRLVINTAGIQNVKDLFYPNYQYLTDDIVRHYKLEQKEPILQFMGKKSEGFPHLYGKRKIYKFIDNMSNVDLNKILKIIKTQKRDPDWQDVI